MRGRQVRAIPGLILMGLALMMLVAVAAGTALAQAGPAVPFVTVAQGNTSGVREPAQFVIRDQAAWQALWRRHVKRADDPIPAIDFGREMVVAIFGGESRVSRQLRIRKIARETDRLEVWYTLAAVRPLPEEDSSTSVVPFHIVRTARSPLPVRFLHIKTPQVY